MQKEIVKKKEIQGWLYCGYQTGKEAYIRRLAATVN
jgi:hypothetical protein